VVGFVGGRSPTKKRDELESLQFEDNNNLPHFWMQSDGIVRRSKNGVASEGCLLFYQKRKSKFGGFVGIPDRQHHY
jgi:hypothetical protein